MILLIVTANILLIGAARARTKVSKALLLAASGLLIYKKVVARRKQRVCYFARRQHLKKCLQKVCSAHALSHVKEHYRHCRTAHAESAYSTMSKIANSMTKMIGVDTGAVVWRARAEASSCQTTQS